MVEYHYHAPGELSVHRIAFGSFFAGVGVLALLSLPLVAVCTGRASLAPAVLAAFVVAVCCALVAVTSFDLLDERSRR